MRSNRHFHTFEPLRTPPHKTQKSAHNDLQTVRFCNGLGRLPNLGFLERPSRLNPRAFKSTFSSLRSRVCLNLPFRGPGKHSPPVRRLAGWNPKVPLSQPFQLCKAECV